MRTLKRKAFFDLDGTIIEEFSGIELARILTELDANSSKWREFWENQGLLKNESVSYEYAIMELSRYFAKGVKNITTRIMKRAIKRLCKCINVKKGFSELYSWLLENEFEIFVLTASPIEVFDAIPDFQFTETFGLVLERNDEYTGRCILSMTTENKKRKIEEKSQDSIFSFGVSDSIHDLEAYEGLDIKFLLDGSSSHNRQYIQVSDLLQAKAILEHKLNRISR